MKKDSKDKLISSLLLEVERLKKENKDLEYIALVAKEETKFVKDTFERLKSSVSNEGVRENIFKGLEDSIFFKPAQPSFEVEEKKEETIECANCGKFMPINEIFKHFCRSI